MEEPQIRPGVVHEGPSLPRVIAFFHNSAVGNSAIQLVLGMGVPTDRLGVTGPEGIEGGQGMLLSIACAPGLRSKVERACRNLGGSIHRQDEG